MTPSVVAEFVPSAPSAIEVHSPSCFAVGLVLWRDETARPIATVVAKLSFRLAPGASSLLEPPEPLRPAESFEDDSRLEGVHAAPDLVPFKAAPEILLVGSLRGDFAEGRLVVGPIDKRITSASPRHFGRRNRDALLEADDRAWLRDPLRLPRPRAFDARYFCFAPPDQRGGAPFRPGEPLTLEGLHPEHRHLVTRLPEVHPAFRSAIAGAHPASFVADTLVVDAERMIATLTFRARVPLGEGSSTIELVALGDGGSDGAGERTRELGSEEDDAGGSTTELDRNALDGVATLGIPFPISAEPSRPTFSNVADGALPFRPSTAAPSDGAASSRATTQVSTAQQAPVVMPPATPIAPPAPVHRPAFGAALIAPEPPSAPLPGRVGFGPTNVETPSPVAGAAPRSALGDVFRRAFGLGPGASGGTDAGEQGATRPGSAAPDAVPAAFSAVASPARVASDAAASAEARPGRMDQRLRPTRGPERRAVVDLLAFDAGVPGRLRRSRTHGPLLATPTPPRAQRQLDAPVEERSAEDRARAEVLRVLSCGTPLGAEEISAALAALLEDESDFDLPLFLVEGELQPSMDELEALRVAVEIARPVAGSNKRVLGAVAAAADALGRTVAPPPETAAALFRQLEVATGELGLPARHLAELVERTLRETRSYRQRTLLGAPRLRAELTLGKVALPIYLPASIATDLPLLPTFRVSALVEARPREDATEPSSTALFALATGRVLHVRG